MMAAFKVGSQKGKVKGIEDISQLRKDDIEQLKLKKDWNDWNDWNDCTVSSDLYRTNRNVYRHVYYFRDAGISV